MTQHTLKNQQNGREKPFKKPLFHKSNKNTGKIIRINFYRTLEMNQRQSVECLFKKNS